MDTTTLVTDSIAVCLLVDIATRSLIASWVNAWSLPSVSLTPLLAYSTTPLLGYPFFFRFLVFDDGGGDFVFAVLFVRFAAVCVVTMSLFGAALWKHQQKVACEEDKNCFGSSPTQLKSNDRPCLRHETHHRSLRPQCQRTLPLGKTKENTDKVMNERRRDKTSKTPRFMKRICSFRFFQYVSQISFSFLLSLFSMFILWRGGVPCVIEGSTENPHAQSRKIETCTNKSRRLHDTFTLQPGVRGAIDEMLRGHRHVFVFFCCETLFSSMKLVSMCWINVLLSFFLIPG